MNNHIQAYNENSWEELCWAIANSSGEFSLILAHCNSANLQRRLTQKLQGSCEVEIQEIVLDKSTKSLYQTIQGQLDSRHSQALIVFGLESVQTLDSLLVSANQIREEFRKNFPFPIVLWVTDEVLQKLIRLAHDLQSWTTTVKFAIATEDLTQIIQETADEVFSKVLAAGAGRFLDNTALNLGMGSPRRIELELARTELQNRGVTLQPELEAGLEFVLGRDVGGNTLETCRQHYERSLLLLKEITQEEQTKPDNFNLGNVDENSKGIETRHAETRHAETRHGASLQVLYLLEKRACLLYCMGLWWRTYAVIHRKEQKEASKQAEDYFQQCITVFEQANRSDLAANFINAWGEVLQRQKHWDELEKVANKALNLHQTYPHQFRLARVYGFLAEVALSQSNTTEAKDKAQQALSILDSTISTAENSSSSKSDSLNIIADLEWERSYHRGWYLFSLAKAQLGLDEVQTAIETLEAAKKQTKHQYDPELYIWILAELRNCYFHQSEYLTAFQIKQQQRSLEQQYGFRAFVGAGRLQPKKQVNNPGLAIVEQQTTVAQEIAASGRQQDIKRLVERIGRPDHKLTLIHGQSGVGKSSILQAGLIPVLQDKFIGARDVLPILQQVYTDWVRELENHLAEVLDEFGYQKNDNRVNRILKQLQKNSENQLLTVLIFDQFEEFFFVYKDPKQRLPFYQFLQQCLDVPHVRVILSLREDYLYYLLECNARLINFEVINNNILDKDVLYYLGNFSPADTKLLIKNLTKTTQLVLEPGLIDALVTELAGELGEIRPIELQVVGTQLQSEKIKTLEKYQEHGPKEELVGRFLEEVVKDCGEENQQITKLILYLLTDENNTRPLKTRTDLELDLDVTSEKLDLVLLILVKSGLVFKIPSVPDDRYQLVHDYLVPFVRQQQSARLIAELEKEREQRKLTEARLLKATQKQLRQAYIAGGVVTGLAILAGTFGLLTRIAETNSRLQKLSSNSKSSLNRSENLYALIKSLTAAKQLQSWSSIGVTPETKMQVMTTLQDVVHTIRERNSLEGHKDAVSKISFSPDGNIIASGGADGEVKIWSKDGKELKTFKAHEEKITSISFSPDGHKLITGSQDKTPKLWNIEDEQLIKVFKGHKDSITSVGFSPDGKKIVSGSKDKTVKIWDLQGKIIKTFDKHEGSITCVIFSPDGKLIASGSKDTTLKLWNLEGKILKTFGHFSTVNSITFSPNGQKIASTYQIYDPWIEEVRSFTKLWRRDGYLIKTIQSNNPIQNIKFSHDGKTIALAGERFMNNKLQDSIYVKKIHINTGNSDNFTLDKHINRVMDISFSPNLQTLASVSKDKTIKLWDIKSRKDLKNPIDVVNKLSFSPNSKLIAAISGEYSTNGKKYTVKKNVRDGRITTTNIDDIVDGNLKIWRIDGRLRNTLPGLNSNFNFSKDDSQILVSASQDRKIQLQRSDNNTIKTLEGKQVHGSISPDKKMIALVQSNNTVELLGLDGKKIASLKGHKDKIYQIFYSKDGNLIVTASKDKTIIIWNDNGKLISTIKVENDNIKAIIISPNKKFYITKDNKNTIKIWRKDGSLIKVINNVKHSLKNKIASIENNIRFSKNSKNIAIWGNDNTVKFITSDGKEVLTLKSRRQMSVSFSSELDIFAITKSNDIGISEVQLRHIDGRLVKKLPGPFYPSWLDRQISVEFTSDDEAIVTYDDSGVKFWKSDGTLLSTFKKQVYSSEILKNPTIVTFGYNNQVKLWQRDGKLIKTIQLKTKSDTDNYRLNVNQSNNKAVTFSSNGQILAIQANRDTIELRKIDGSFLGHIPVNRDKDTDKEDESLDYRDSLFSDENMILDFSSDGQTLAIHTDNNSVQIWKLDNKASLVKNIEIEDAVLNLNFLADNNTLAITTGLHTAKLWKLADEANKGPKLLQTFSGHKNQVTGVSISPDGQRVASASHDKTVKFWQRGNKLPLYTFKKHTDKVNSVSFSPDGKVIASASDDKTVKVWQPDDDGVKNCKGHSKGVTSVSFSPNGQIIASIGKDNTVRLWSIEGEKCKSLKPLNSGDSVYGLSFSSDSGT